MHRQRVLLLAGGHSEEHDVSMVSARSVLAALEGSAIDASVQVVSRAGRWLSHEDGQRALRAGRADAGGDMMLQGALRTQGYDAVFPLIHGPFGEDGRLQGLLEMADVPYVGSGVLASAVCMDKTMTKQVLQAGGLSQVAYVGLTRQAFMAKPQEAIDRIVAKLSAPWFVKPANLGSSVGISKVVQPQNLQAALQHAFTFDRRAIIEAGVVGVRELEVAVLGNGEPQASPVGEITYQADFYDYATKYSDGRAQMSIPAKLEPSVAAHCRALALDAYSALDCAGLARVDLFYRPHDGALFVNELNTIPGFTPLSMFPKLWAAGGIDFVALIQTLVRLAIERHAERPQLQAGPPAPVAG